MSEPNPISSESSEVSVRIEDVSVRYRVPSEPIQTFKEYVIRSVQGKLKLNDFWALRHISLEIKKGEVFGIIGRNGAGKSTLLKLVARVLRPSSGRVWVSGMVVPLLELGAGFHPELTGRENIYLNGAMLGFTRAEMEEKAPRIIEFSELGKFIDVPLRAYSTGMWARLGFAAATDTPPKVLIVDEILGVGDEAFQKKCTARIASFRDLGTTILLVSHNAATINQMCQRAMWLDYGVLKVLGTPKEVLDAYHESQ